MIGEKLNSIFANIGSSFKNNSDGYSAKKITAYTIVVCVIAAHVKWLSIGNLTQLEMVLTIDYGFIAVLFGINVYDKKNNPVDKKE